ncbi:SDH family Clp fold serine proteinase [Verminephrobacter aporrectodeae]|uniref:SDH family Clp fold serine proteinase n=1 Tax=Verminephrobacter aporrectodeae TaxID=1110389 RepID=UPI0009D9C1B7|nr:hypothetical protein [Verminephrobacter aporrectodeae]
MNGYEAVCDHLEKRPDKDATRALLIIATPGGDPDAGFRIARALQHSYQDGFEALVPRYCKSAGTLVLLGATKILMANRSELGPLDIQIKKGDELFGRNSGLDINEAVGFLREETLTSFNTCMHKLVQQGLSTKIAAEIAVKLVNGIFHPISAQIEPLKLAEMQRATSIAYTYGRRLVKVGRNVTLQGLITLVGGYPSHGFVIDRKEARTIFENVASPADWHVQLCESFQKKYAALVNDSVAHITLETKTIEISDQPEGAKNDAGNTSPGATAKSQGTPDSAVIGNGRANSPSPKRQPASTKSAGKGIPL